jgi:sulfur carrier protein ThiS
MCVKLKFRNNQYEVEAGMTVRRALEKIDIQLDAVLATRNGELLTEDEVLKEGDVIRLLAVISGGSI